MASDTEDRMNSASSQSGTLRRVTPDELNEVLTQARDEKWTDLVVVGPGAWTGWTSREWLQSLRGRLVLKLRAHPRSLPSMLQPLGHLRSLVLWQLKLNDRSRYEESQFLEGLE